MSLPSLPTVPACLPLPCQVRQPLNGSYAVRVIDTGDAGEGTRPLPRPHATALLRSATGCVRKLLPFNTPLLVPVHAPSTPPCACTLPPPRRAAGNVRWSWNNTTIACSRPEVAPPPPPSSPAEAAAVVAHHTASTGIASTADELLFLLSTPDITRVVVGGEGLRWLVAGKKRPAQCAGHRWQPRQVSCEAARPSGTLPQDWQTSTACAGPV